MSVVLRFLLCLSACFALACGPAPRRPDPEVCPDTDTDMAFCVDQTDERVGPALSPLGVGRSWPSDERYPCFYADEAEHLWFVDPETAEASAVLTVESIAFSEPNCAGRPYIVRTLPEPRLTVSLPDGTIRVRPDTLVGETFTPRSTLSRYNSYWSSNARCSSWSGESRIGVSIDSMEEVSLPSLPFAPPLRVQYPQ